MNDRPMTVTEVFQSIGNANRQARDRALRALNSLTKYPSIPTYHELDPRNGQLIDTVVPFTGDVIVTEKIDGTNGRIIFVGESLYLIGSREELLYASGDVLHNPAMGIVDAVRQFADWAHISLIDNALVTYYVEVYGGGVGQGWKQYADDKKQVGFRLFDILDVRDYREVVEWSSEKIAGWRDGGGQLFVNEQDLSTAAAFEKVELTPRVATVKAEDLPTTIEDTLDWLRSLLPATKAGLGENVGKAEGVVLRAPDRSVIAKARFSDYERTLRRRK
jgi:hypothetical protein